MDDIKTMVKALRVLAQDIQSEDMVANICVSNAANLIESLDGQNEALRAENKALKDFKLHILELAKNHNCDSITQLATKCSKQCKRIAELEMYLNKCLLFTEEIHYLDVDLTINNSVVLNNQIKKVLEKSE